MQLNGTEVRYGLQSSVDFSSVNTIGTAQLGTPSSAFPYVVAPNVAYSLVLEIEPGDTLTLDTTTGNITGAAGDTRAYRIDGMTWNSTDIEGQTLPLVPSICGVLVRCGTPGAIVTVTAGGEDTIITAPAINLTASAEGRHPWSVEDIAFTADAAGSAAVVVIDIHASSAAIELSDPPEDGDTVGINQQESITVTGVNIDVVGSSQSVTVNRTAGGAFVADYDSEVGDTAGVTVTKMAAALNLESGFSAYATATALEGVLTVTKVAKSANDPLLSIEATAGVGLTISSPSTNLTVGYAPASGDVATYVGEPAIVDGTDIYRALTINPTTWSAQLN